MNSKQGVLGYLVSLKASIDPDSDGNSVALVDRAHAALSLIEDAVFDAHELDAPGEEPLVTEGHIGAVGHEHLTEADIGAPVTTSVAPAPATPPPAATPPLFPPN